LSDTISDHDLLKQMRRGDEEAFISLYRRRQGGVYRFALQMSGSESIAEDVTQEVFFLLMREAESYDATRGTLTAFLYGVARNLLRQRLDKESRFVTMLDEELQERGEAFLSASDPLAELTRNESVERLRQAILALPASYREIVVLCDLHELSYVEAAQAAHCAVGTVRSRLHRARALLAARLRADSEAEISAKKKLSASSLYLVRGD